MAMPDSQQDVPVARPERHLLGGPDGQGGVLRGVQPRQVRVHGIRRIRNQQCELDLHFVNRKSRKMRVAKYFTLHIFN